MSEGGWDACLGPPTPQGSREGMWVVLQTGGGTLEGSRVFLNLLLYGRGKNSPGEGGTGQLDGLNFTDGGGRKGKSEHLSTDWGRLK